ncbi:MAG: response regulator [Chloroflexota bacterium]|nr:response regulator [Chloroflexota bacterium]
MARIVFCEDDPTIQKLVRAALRDSGHEIHIASDGEEGLALVRALRPDLVFSDVSMPKLDGYQLGDALKGSPDTAGIPLVFVTASVQRSQIAEAERHGAAGVLPKPFTMAELRQRVAQLVEPEDRDGR